MARKTKLTPALRSKLIRRARKAQTWGELAKLAGISGRTLKRYREADQAFEDTLSTLLGAGEVQTAKPEAPPEEKEREAVDAVKQAAMQYPAPPTHQHVAKGLRELFDIWTPEQQVQYLVERQSDPNEHHSVRKAAMMSLNRVMFSGAALREQLRIEREAREAMAATELGQSKQVEQPEVIEAEVVDKPRPATVWLSIPRNGSEGGDVIEIPQAEPVDPDPGEGGEETG